MRACQATCWMPKVNPQLGLDPRVLAELLDKLPDALPFLELAVAIGRAVMAKRNPAATKAPCAFCPKTDCVEICELLAAHLDGPYEGKLHGETTIGVNLDEVRAREGAPEQGSGDEDVKKADRGTFRGFRPVEPVDLLEPYKACWDRLTQEQREVVLQYYGEGKKVGAIAKALRRSASSVSGRLKRAKQVKEEYAAEMRRKEFELWREAETNSHEE